MIIDTQAVHELLVTLGISAGVVVAVALSFLASVAAWRRYDRKAHISAVERYLAFVAAQRRGQQRPTHTS